MARRSKRRQVKKRQTKRVQRGGGFWDGIKSLFTRKAANQNVVMQNPMRTPMPPVNPTFSMVNPMRAAMPAPVNAALNNITQRRNQATQARNNANFRREGNNIIRSGNNANYNRIMREKENEIRELGGEIPEREPITQIRVPTNEEVESEFEEYMSRQGGGGLTAAEIDRLASNI